MAKIVSLTTSGDYRKTEKFLHGVVERHYMRKMHHYGKLGVRALHSATPKDSGKTAESWSYEIVEEAGRISIYWKNTNVNNGVNIAIILQYGHGTRNGGYVEGIDYINPALKPVFQDIADEAWKEVVSS